MVKNWYAVYTRPHQESKVVDLLKRKNFESYLPQNKLMVNNGFRKKQSFVPLFKSLVFVKTSENRVHELLRMDGVINMVYWQGKPAVIRDVEIYMMNSFVDDYQYVKLEKTEVNVADTVRIIKSETTSTKLYLHPSEKEEFRLVLPSLGYILVAQADVVNVKVVKKAENDSQPEREHKYAIQ